MGTHRKKWLQLVLEEINEGKGEDEIGLWCTVKPLA